MTDTPKKVVRDFNAFLKSNTQTETTPRQRLERALSFNPSGRPGADDIRNRQARIYDRLAAISKQFPKLTPTAWKNAVHNRQSNPERKRANSTGDAHFAIQIAQAYHYRVKSLYQSSRAEIVYGRGGQEETDWSAYSKRYGFPANWKNAGCEIAYDTNKGNVIILENHLGNQVACLDLPSQKERSKWRFAADLETHGTNNALIYGDLFGIERHKGVIERFGVKRKKVKGEYTWFYQRTGLAFLIDSHPESGQPYWEHGETLKVIKQEVQHKRRAAELRKQQQIQDAPTLRMERLILRLCNKLEVTRDHAQSLGYCNAGIDAYCKRFNLNQNSAPLAQIRPTGNWMAMNAAKVAARECAIQRLKNRNSQQLPPAAPKQSNNLMKQIDKYLNDLANRE